MTSLDFHRDRNIGLTPEDFAAANRTQALAGAHHAVAAAGTALRAATTGEPDRTRAARLGALHAVIADLELELRELRGVR